MSTATASRATAAQRTEALGDGNSVRSRRAQLKRDLARDRQTAGPLLADLLLHPPSYLKTALIHDALTWPRGHSGNHADRILQAAGVTSSLCAVAELSQEQQSAIATFLTDPAALNAVEHRKRSRRLVAAAVRDDIPF
jgi:hypothetical protein